MTDTTHNPRLTAKSWLGISAAVCLGVASSGVVQSDELNVQKLKTPNGHTFWYHQMPEADRTAIAVSWAQEVPVGENSHPAIARIGIDVMLNGGAGGRDAADIVADYQDLDSGSGLWVQPRHVSGFIVAPDQHLSTAREIAQVVMTQPAMEERWFEREQQRIVEQSLEDNANSWGVAWNLTRDVLLGDHPYKDFWSFTPLDDVKGISFDDINEWFKASFSTETITVAVAGSAMDDVVAKELDALFTDMPRTAAKKPIEIPKPVVQGKTILLHKPDAPKTVVVILGAMPDHDQTKNLPLQLSVGVLGFGKQSRLFKTVRSGMGATYGFGAGIFDFTREHRMFEMSGEIETAKLQDALEEIEEAYTEFRDDGIGRVEFPIAKRIYKREVTKQLQSPVNLAFTIKEAVLNGFSPDYVPSFVDRIDDMGRDSTNEIISTSFPAYSDLMKIIVTADKSAVAGACVVSAIEEAAGCLDR